MPNPYREIFQVPGAFAFSSAGFIARLPASMVGLGIVTSLTLRAMNEWYEVRHPEETP